MPVNYNCNTNYTFADMAGTRAFFWAFCRFGVAAGAAVAVGAKGVVGAGVAGGVACFSFGSASTRIGADGACPDKAVGAAGTLVAVVGDSVFM